MISPDRTGRSGNPGKSGVILGSYLVIRKMPEKFPRCINKLPLCTICPSWYWLFVYRVNFDKFATLITPAG